VSDVISQNSLPTLPKKLSSVSFGPKPLAKDKQHCENLHPVWLFTKTIVGEGVTKAAH
jgi:hypothetical protein